MPEHYSKKRPARFIYLTHPPAIAHSRFVAASLENGLLNNAANECSKDGLKKLLDRIKSSHKNNNHHFKTISSFSFLINEVFETVTKHDIDLVLVETKDASGMEKVFMGSNSVRIIKAVKHCPLLAIPQNFDYIKPAEIAFATDFYRFYTNSELKPVIDLATSFGAVVRIVHVQYELKVLAKLQQFNLSVLPKYLGDVEHFVYPVSELNSVSKTLEKFAIELDIHLLAMLQHQHSYMERLTREPVVKRVAFHTNTPLLVIPELSLGTSTKKSNKEISFSN
jgi:nucleotide-binding universal stress UspA family protein